jgi:dolichol-phosphate mannosyltransferase
MFLSIVIAVYNEEDNVVPLTNRIYQSMKNLQIPFELIYIIDGDDRSFEYLKEIQNSENNLILDHSPQLRGFKNSFVKGFSLMDEKATHILTLDGDLNHQPEEIGNLINRFEITNADIVVGSRYLKKRKIEKMPFWKKGISVLANFVIRMIWKLDIKDKTSGFRLYRKEVIATVVPLCKSKNFEFLLEILILSKKQGYILKEEPIIFKAREKGVSKFELGKIIKGYFKLLLKYSPFSNNKPIITKYVADKRVALILKTLRKLDKSKIKILDVGCGDRYITNIIKSKGYNIVGIDQFNKEGSKWITQDPDYIMDARALSFEDNSFDVIISLEVIEHCDCTSEIMRVLKKNGLFFCSTPTPFTDWVRKILVLFKLLENQDFEGHDHIVNLKKIPFKLLSYRKMFLGTSQFGIFTK